MSAVTEKVGQAMLDFLSDLSPGNHTFQIIGSPHGGAFRAEFQEKYTDGPVRQIEMLEIELPRAKGD